jgi:hypothetical protein
VQRPSEHPFIKRLIPTIANQQAAREALSLGPGLPFAIERILDNNAWFYTITGAHAGGGLDSTIIIQKTQSESSDPSSSERPSDPEAPAGAEAAAVTATVLPAPPSELTPWASGISVYTPLPAAGIPVLQFGALLLVLTTIAVYRSRMVGAWRRASTIVSGSERFQ